MRRIHLVALALGTLFAAPVAAQDRTPVRVETLVAPDSIGLGEVVTFTWRAWLPKGSTMTFPARPADDSLHHWLAWTTETKDTKGALREHRLVGRFQSFALGTVAVPGPPIRFAIPGEETRQGRFPTSAFTVVPVVPLEGEEPPLKDLHDLVPPPWWATWPWAWIAAGLVALVVVGLVLRRWLRKGPRHVPGAAPAPVPLEPAEVEARRRLAALRALGLPEAGRTYEHGTELADLLRRFVERRFAGLEPGWTTRELARRLAARGDIAPSDGAELVAILEACDLTKFARRPYDAPRAHAAEAGAARLVDAWAAPPAAVKEGAA